MENRSYSGISKLSGGFDVGGRGVGDDGNTPFFLPFLDFFPEIGGFGAQAV